jgi:uncharacterized Zn finger protein (UPF0148 family)
MEKKKLCPIHYFMYSGSICPICEQERIAAYANKFVKKQDEKLDTPRPVSVAPVSKTTVYKKKVDSNRPVTEDDLMKLMNKFGSNLKKK